MDFFVGLLTGMGLLMVARCAWRELGPISGVEKPDKTLTPQRKEWSRTKNFLYYDGTVMPEIKEDAHEH